MSTTTSRRALLGGLMGGAAASMLPAPQLAVGAPARAVRRPNILVVSIDDLGWRELGCYGHEFNETPEIDKLAHDGMRFTNAYAAAPLCSPTRAALVSGLYPARSGITDFLHPEQAPGMHFLSPRTHSLPDALGRAGYTSGMIGKWHLTEDYTGRYRNRRGNPYALGFDEVRASESRYIADGDYVAPYAFMPALAGPRGEYLTDRLASEATEYITKHRDEPFFLHVSNFAVHTRLQGKPELLAKYKAKAGAGKPGNSPVLAAMLESVDQQVGRIVRTLDELGLAGDTLLMVTSDNGAPRHDANAPLRGGKGQLYEGGIRVPLVARWPGTVAAGRTDDTMTSTIDLLPTAVELAGRTPQRKVDGLSIAPLLTGTGTLDRETLFWVHRPGFRRADTRAAVRVGDLKLIRQGGHSELYDLGADPGESHNLAGRKPKTVKGMNQLLNAHLRDVDAGVR
ncbi:sulfatase [Nocardioides sp. InS609-2]|uniref:sulfatase n=1 Tax=Nocardioides sp. InS609-2 TaxID=2760705 RepID=UPI0020BE2428|nr:sulfatase [Nocardioides sp. InS609-2]